MKHISAIRRFQVRLLWLLLLLLPPSLVLCRLPSSFSSSPASAATTTTAAMATTEKGGPPPDCPTECGDVKIPYPFGIGARCSWRESFAIDCNHSRHGHLTPYYRDYEVVDITLGAGEMRVVSTVVHKCFDNSSIPRRSRRFNFTDSPFQISSSRNEFTGIGCHATAWQLSHSYLSGCATSCEKLDDDDVAAGDDDLVVSPTCSTERGCCNISMPNAINGLYFIQVETNITDGTREYNNRCSYGFVAEKGRYIFDRSDLDDTGDEMAIQERFRQSKVPVVLEWSISKNEADAACVSEHSKFQSKEGGGGYLCQCSKGYDGNPYIKGGCRNINECHDPTKLPKYGRKCTDTDGDYDWKCTVGRRKVGSECQLIIPISAIATLGTFAGIILLLLTLWFARKAHKMRVKRKFFDKNGGEILRHMNIKTFTELQLKEITNNYNNPIGSGAFGKVFMGSTKDNLRVAVKRSKEGNQNSRNDNDLANEIAVQFLISHPNLVRLIGCCLETDFPMLVYEYVSNGSLYDVLHDGGTNLRTLPLLARLDIALGSAKALAYMHSQSHGHNPIIHGDVKSGNILLGDNLTPKVSDFGTSKLVSIVKDTNGCVVADRSYADPVYMNTGHFTEKSDVYSFGVVLLELITRKKAKYNNDNSLPKDFVEFWKKNANGRAMYDKDIFSDENAQSHQYMECLDRIGALAVRCLSLHVDDRPTMEEVMEELKLAKASACGGSSSGVTENQIQEASEACMPMSVNLRQRSPCTSFPGSTVLKTGSMGLRKSPWARLTPLLLHTKNRGIVTPLSSKTNL